MTISRNYKSAGNAVLGPFDIPEKTLQGLKRLAETEKTTVRALVRKWLAELAQAQFHLSEAEKAATEAEALELAASQPITQMRLGELAQADTEPAPAPKAPAKSTADAILAEAGIGLGSIFGE